MAHRIMAGVVVVVMGALAWLLWRAGAHASAAAPCQGFAAALAGLLLAQVASGLSNVVLGWPLLAALGHSAGAAGLVLLLTLVLARSAPHRFAAAP